MTNKKIHIVLLLLFGAILLWSVIKPFDMFTWVLEVLPALLGLIFLIAFYPKFKFTNFVYIMILIHCSILIIGGHYSYAKMPLFDYIKDIFDLQRNYYDRLGHFSQGFFPALVIREVLIRNRVVQGKGWLSFIVASITLSISALYELVEFATAKIFGGSADDFLGMQGDIWDSQWDMTFALIGAVTALLLFSKLHNKFIQKCMNS